MAIIELILKVAGLLIVSPLFQGLIKRLKGILQGRKGPPVLQPYRDLYKYYFKERVVSKEVTWVFHLAPLAAFSSIFIAGIMVPWVNRSEWGFFADLILFVYLLGIPRFMLALAGLDASGSFGGMSSSREMAVSALVEPALFLALLTLLLSSHSLRLDTIISSAKGIPFLTPPGFLAGLAFFIVVIAEVGRIPVDNPDTHLELTMIHEGMVLEYSGRQLGLLHFAHWIKQLTLVMLLFNGFAPFGLTMFTEATFAVAATCFALKLLIGAALLALTESLMVKMRLFQMMDLLGFSFVLSATSLIFVATGG